jgi:hypothetical protein
MVEDITPQIREQVCMWRDQEMDTPNRPYQYLIDVIIRVITTPASEANAERALSRQK